MTEVPPAEVPPAEVPPPPEELLPEPGWVPCPQVGIYRPERNFISGDPHGSRLRVAYWRRESDAAFVGKVWFGPLAEGPPLCAHGGAVAAVLDDVMGRGAWVAGHPVLAGEITIQFKARVPLGQVLWVEGLVQGQERRKIRTEGRLLTPEGELLARSTGTFIEILPGHFEAERARLESLGIVLDDPVRDLDP